MFAPVCHFLGLNKVEIKDVPNKHEPLTFLKYVLMAAHGPRESYQQQQQQ